LIDKASPNNANVKKVENILKTIKEKSKFNISSANEVENLKSSLHPIKLETSKFHSTFVYFYFIC